ncbi:MAG TPA: hypothetical protein VER79_09730, partial [Candidatus Limnocylindrales bacterium]|nr:hypothetical protein [Candidatus Limnocylindrales bacterium]
FEGGDRWLGDVRLAQYVMPVPLTEACAEDAQFGEQITLNACRLNARALAPGDALQLQFEWVTAAPLTERYKVFVQLLDADGQLVAQRDSEPVGGLGLTTTWQPGQPVRDNHALFLPTNLPPGDYRLIVGLYALDAPNVRLPVSTGGDYVDLGRISVR